MPAPITIFVLSTNQFDITVPYPRHVNLRKAKFFQQILGPQSEGSYTMNCLKTRITPSFAAAQTVQTFLANRGETVYIIQLTIHPKF